MYPATFHFSSHLPVSRTLTPKWSMTDPCDPPVGVRSVNAINVPGIHTPRRRPFWNADATEMLDPDSLVLVDVRDVQMHVPVDQAGVISHGELSVGRRREHQRYGGGQ